ncbi:MAG: phosphate/phosphite/phosphonate ABC transporter substrate-binding protein [Tepidimonas sp.]|uniref:phosphate/phosphite/phosphonate ABC transporter substrate-binding protein n=1 Tax=Tepidimonas sp. TaxID=2002775 RepID=UPI00298EED34|nr:phosphate/phosphite/phosphonate ABC transporter substrate-binding protein [Tepidimonas sp.]MCS6810466.1 phosphate/phosphite/phosphonate ABC transporter substrate-binding protein [Tepidimonas sp.]MDW8337070.1 phosphate/phosphite/phosphonate ABC transporter substrate-binding protein [Tepidimonas sp.]
MLAIGRPAGSQPRPLLLGIVPYLTARRLAELYEPLRQFFERELGQPVGLETASSYVAYHARCAAGDYDVLATSPALGRIAEREQGYLPLARPLTDLEPLLVVLRDSPLREVRELRGKVVTTSDPMATLTLAARRYLAEAGLPPGPAVTVRAMGTHANSLAALVHGESAAAVVSVTALKQIGGDWPERVRVLARVPPTPPLLYMAHRRLGAPTIERLQRQMLRFGNETPEGQELFRRLGHDGLRPITAADLAALDPFVADVKRLLDTL